MLILGFAFSLTALAWASFAASVASTGVAVYSQRQQGKAAEAAGKADAATARAEALRKEALSRENIKRQREMDRRYLSTQKAQYAASGVQLKGTPLLVMGKTASNLELEIMDLAFQASEGSRQLELQAKNSMFEGRQGQKAANIKAGASLLQGATKLGSDLYEYDKNKTPKE